MELKYCESCGVFLGEVLETKRYCKECAKAIKQKREAARRAPFGVVPCEWCKRPMCKLYECQKYHQKCAKLARRKKTADWWKKHPDYIRVPDRPVEIAKEESKKPKYTIEQIDRKAKELGMSYGHYGALLEQGKVDPPDER